MARGVQGGGCVIVHVGSRRLIPKQEPPKDNLGGQTESRFLWVCRVKVVGQTVQGTPTGDFGLTGFGGASVCLQPMVDWKKTGTPRHENLHRRFFEVWEIGLGAQESVRRPEHLFIQTEVVGVAFGSLLNPSTFQTMWASRSAYPQPA